MLATSVLAVGQDAASAAAREGSTGNLALGTTQLDTHRFATLEGRQLRTSTHVDTDRYTGYAPEGAALTVTGDGTAIADAGSATSRIPAAGVRLSESLAASHEDRAAEAHTLGQHWSTEAATARTAAATDATSMAERFSRDLSTGTAYARGFTESETSQAQALQTHMDRLSEMGSISKDEMATLTAEARLAGGLGKVVSIGASGSAQWRGQTFSRESWQQMQDYAEQNQVLDLWSSVSEASRRYSTATGESDMASLEESYGANLSRMRQYRENATLSYQSAETWSEQAARVRSDAQAIDRELGQPFFQLVEHPRRCGRQADRGRRRHAARFSANPGGRGGTPPTCRQLHCRAVPGARAPGPGVGPGTGRVRSGARQAGRSLRPRDRGSLWRLGGIGLGPRRGYAATPYRSRLGVDRARRPSALHRSRRDGSA